MGQREQGCVSIAEIKAMDRRLVQVQDGNGEFPEKSPA